MKRILATSFLALNLAAFTLAAPSVAWSHEGKDPAQWAAKSEEHKQKKMEHLTRELSLTAEQQTQVRSILDDKHQRMNSLFEEYKDKDKDDAFRERKSAIKKDSQDKITALLTPEQKTRYDALKASMKDKHGHKECSEKKNKS